MFVLGNPENGPDYGNLIQCLALEIFANVDACARRSSADSIFPDPLARD